MSKLRPHVVGLLAFFLGASCVIETVPLPEGTQLSEATGDTADKAGGDERTWPPGGDGHINGGGGDPVPEGDPMPTAGDLGGDPLVAGDPLTQSGPTIIAIDGNGMPTTGGGLNTAHHFADGLFIYGTEMSGAVVELTPDGGAPFALVIRGGMGSTSIEVELPQALAAGAYTLTVATAAGSDQVPLAIFQGVPGAPCPD